MITNQAWLMILLQLVAPGIALSTTSGGTGAHFVDNAGRTGLLWSSIGLAVLTSLLQGAVTTAVSIAEDQNMWTFRFRIARFEHWWWTVISFCLSTSFALIVLSFLSGNNNDSLGVLALSTATALAIVRYAIPAWRNKHFIENRWLAWTGSSRTGIEQRFACVCGNDAQWRKLDVKSTVTRAPPPSDDWGFAIRSPPGIVTDPTAILNGLGDISPDLIYRKNREFGPCVYDDGMHGSSDMNLISLLWGEREGFRRRVSRAINSMPSGMLRSKPYTVDGYSGEGLCLALGILGRNKGVQPRELVFDYDDSMKMARGLKRVNANSATTATLENTSVFYPRPNQVMRSYYQQAMQEQFGTLPKAYVGAATELSLILLDCLPGTIRDWLALQFEQQSMEVNAWLSRPASYENGRQAATPLQLQTLYQAQYVSMILSLNYFPVSGQRSSQPNAPSRPTRPDLICFTFLYLAEGAVKIDPDDASRYGRGNGAPEPAWWRDDWVQSRLRAEASSLIRSWQQAAAWLLGLTEPPVSLVDSWPSWPSIVYEPSYPKEASRGRRESEAVRI